LPIPKPQLKSNQTLDLPTVHHPQPKQINLISKLNKKVEIQSENPSLLKNPVAIPITPIQSTVTVIQNPNENTPPTIFCSDPPLQSKRYSIQTLALEGGPATLKGHIKKPKTKYYFIIYFKNNNLLFF
jgi:hypothetical protein